MYYVVTQTTVDFVMLYSSVTKYMNSLSFLRNEMKMVARLFNSCRKSTHTVDFVARL